MFTKQRLLALLLVLNIIVSCLVICFSYGLYQNYNAYIRKGENQQIMSLRIYPQLGIAHKNEHGVMVSTVTKGGLTELLLSLSDEFTDDLECVGMIHGFMNDLFRYKKYEDKDYEDDSEIEYDDEGLYGASMTFTVKNGQILPFGRIADHISDEDYSKGRKCVVVGTELYDPKHHSSVGVVDRNATARLLSGNDKYITIEGERFDIIRADKQLDGYIYIPFTSIKDDTELWISPDRSIITLSFKQELTSTLYNELKEKAAVVLGDKAYIEELQFTEAEEIYYYRAVLLISVLIAILAAVNMAILYRYILERRSRELAIFRICGCGKLRAVMMYLAECMLINLPLFALTEFLWHRLLMKRFASLFEHFENAYSFKLYAVIFGIYAVSSRSVSLLTDLPSPYWHPQSYCHPLEQRICELWNSRLPVGRQNTRTVVTGTLPSPVTRSLRTNRYSPVRLLCPMTSMTTVTTLSTATPISKLMSSMSFLGALFRNSSYTIQGGPGFSPSQQCPVGRQPALARQADCRMRCCLLHG